MKNNKNIFLTSLINSVCIWKVCYFRSWYLCFSSHCWHRYQRIYTGVNHIFLLTYTFKITIFHLYLKTNLFQKRTSSTSGNIKKEAFWESVKGEKGKKPNQMITTGLTHLRTEAQTQQGAHSAKERPGRATPGAGTPGARPRPALCRLAPPRYGGSVINRGWRCGGRIRGIFPPNRLITPYIREGTHPSLSHTTTTHSFLTPVHSSLPLLLFRLVRIVEE
jgi:hypothetical protein